MEAEGKRRAGEDKGGGRGGRQDATDRVSHPCFAVNVASSRGDSQAERDGERMKLLATAVEHAMDGIIISDLNGDIISINRAGARMLEDSTARLAGRHMGEFWSPHNPEHLREEVYRATLRGGWEGELIYRRSDGKDFPAYVSSAVVKGPDGRPAAMVGIFHDVSDRRRMTEEILRRNRELAVLNAVANTSARALDLESTLRDCLDTVVTTMNYDSGIIYMKEGSSDIVCRAQCCLPRQALSQVDTKGEAFARRVTDTGRACYIDDVSARTEDGGMGEGPDWFASTAGVPIISKERTLGVMSVFTREPHVFDDSERSLLEAVARNIGGAIENARLFDDVARGKAEWEATFDAMTNGVSIHDCNFTILRANRNLARMLNTTTTELVGRKCYEVFHGRSSPIANCPQEKCVRTGRNVSVTLAEPAMDAMLSISVDPIHDKEERVIGTVHDVRDITEQEQLREQLSRSERLRALGELAGGVAHDFNNYLTIILGNVQLLLAGDNGGDASARESLEAIQRASSEAAETVRRIQEFTRVRTSRSFTTVDINSVISDAVEVSRPRWKDEARAGGVGIEVVTDLGELPPVNANRSELGEVFMNLLFNAADALEQGGRIDIESRAAGDWVEVTVSDNGVGMDEGVMRRAFDPFYTTKGPEGMGLGLSVTYGIITRHGGEISVESGEGEGATFLIRLPVATVTDLEDVLGDTPEEGVHRRARVLVIDDMEMIRSLLGDVLEGLGQEVETAGSGVAGLELFRESMETGRPFDLVFTDLTMPEMSGWEVVEAVKRSSPDTWVAMITGWGDQLDPERMAASRVDEVIAKPFRMEDVRRLLAKAVNGAEGTSR